MVIDAYLFIANKLNQNEFTPRMGESQKSEKRSKVISPNVPKQKKNEISKKSNSKSKSPSLPQIALIAPTPKPEKIIQLPTTSMKEILPSDILEIDVG